MLQPTPDRPPQCPDQWKSTAKEQFEVANIINSRNNARTGRLQDLVEWLGYEGTDEHTSWEPKDNVISAKEKIEEFHLRYPDKPSSDIRKRQRTTAKRI